MFRNVEVKRESAAAHLLRVWLLNIEAGGRKTAHLQRILTHTKTKIMNDYFGAKNLKMNKFTKSHHTLA